MSKALIKPEGEDYMTSDQSMVEVLLMRGHRPVRLETQDNRLIYVFRVLQVWNDVEEILTGGAKEMTFSFLDWWKAKATWQMNLNNLRQARDNVRVDEC